MSAVDGSVATAQSDAGGVYHGGLAGCGQGGRGVRGRVVRPFQDNEPCTQIVRIGTDDAERLSMYSA